ncbi:MAG: hypothetical protein HW389_2181, partial [Bacteroidetes bacterium]|nr:hypothetical protein [Bacteroidota bacterium]
APPHALLPLVARDQTQGRVADVGHTAAGRQTPPWSRLISQSTSVRSGAPAGTEYESRTYRLTGSMR